MNTNSDFDRHAAAWLAGGPTELADRVLDAALREVHLTKQRRAMRVPWRFPLMPARFNATSVAAVVLVAVVGTGALIYLNSTRPASFGGQPTAPPTSIPTAVPTAAPAPSLVAPGITGWTSYTTAVHSFHIGYPAGWVVDAPATRPWQAGDAFPGDELPFADTFVSSEGGDAQIGLLAWEMPAENGADLHSVEGLKAWAETFCRDVGGYSCAAFEREAVPMCLNVGDNTCTAAILVPTAELQYAFFSNISYPLLARYPVRVVVVARADDFPGAAPYGGSVALLKSILTTMDVWAPGASQLPPSWIVEPRPGG